MPREHIEADNNTLLQAVLHGLQIQRDRIEQQISEVKTQLGATDAGRLANHHTPQSSSNGGRRPLSAAARKRIADAQRRRWAEYRKASSDKQA